MTQKNRRPASPSPCPTPLTAWTDLALQTGEMVMASLQVIGHRTQRMVASQGLPNALDRAEFSLMGQEKLEAASESVQAMGALWHNTQVEFGAQALEEILLGWNDCMSLLPSPPGSWPQPPTQAFDVYTRATDGALQLSTNLVRIAQAGLAPIHSRATANAKRLGS